MRLFLLTGVVPIDNFKTIYDEYLKDRIMRRLLVIVAALCIGLAGHSIADAAVGSAFGNLTTAKTLGQGIGNFGAGVGIADATSAFGSFTYGLSRFTDGRLRLGLWDAGAGSSTRIAFGADFKWQFWTAGAGRREPFDMSFGGGFEFVDAGPISVFQFGGNVVGSYPFKMSNGSTLSPYGRFNVRVESLSGSQTSNTDLCFGLNGGVSWAATRNVTIFGEFQFDGNDGVFFGLDFNVM
jgi:hypothetical protein